VSTTLSQPLADAQADPQLDTPLPPPRRDLAPLLLAPAVALATLPFVDFPVWVTLTIAGLAMGMMIFIMASGLTLVFGLMGVLNFGHGAFVTVGAYVATLVLLPMRGWLEADALGPNLAVLLLAVGLAVAVTFVLGWAFERVVVRPVYGHHLKQILVTMGGMIVSEQLVTALWGPEQIALPLPAALRGAVFLGDAAIEKYRLLAVAVGLGVFAALFLVLNRTRLGLLIRAGVENGEMVEALGYRIRRLFVAVFAAGSALAGLGGVLWGLYKGMLSAEIGRAHV